MSENLHKGENGHEPGSTELDRPDVALILEDQRRQFDTLREEHSEIRATVIETRNAVGVVNTLCTEVLDTLKTMKLETELVRGQCIVLSERTGVIDRRLDQLEREREAERAAHSDGLAALKSEVGELAAGVGRLTGETAAVKARFEQERDRRASFGEAALEEAARTALAGRAQTAEAVQRAEQEAAIKLKHETRRAQIEVIKSVAIVVLTGLAGLAVAAAKGCF